LPLALRVAICGSELAASEAPVPLCLLKHVPSLPRPVGMSSVARRLRFGGVRSGGEVRMVGAERVLVDGARAADCSP